MKNRKFWVSLIAGILAAVMLLGLVISIFPKSVNAASSSEIQSQIDDLESQQTDIQSQIDELETQIQENLEDMQDTVEQKLRIDQQIFLLHQQIDNLNDQIRSYGVLIADKQDELDDARERYQTLSDKNRERVRAMEEDGKLSYWSVLFKANSFADLLDRLNMIEEIAAADQRRLKELSEAADQVARVQEELQASKEALEGKRADVVKSQEELAGKREEASSLLSDLRSRGEEYQEYLAEAEKAKENLMIDIANKQNEYDEAVAAEYWEQYWATYVPPTTLPPETSDSSGEGSESGGESSGGSESGGSYDPSSEGWLCPVDWYIVTDPFGMRLHPYSGEYTMHYGVDLACNGGMPIYASRSGFVSTATEHWSFGNYVTIDHSGGYRTMYAHMSYYIVSAGEYVRQGQVIGYVGSTGESTGDHCHFCIIDNGTYVNPMSYI